MIAFQLESWKDHGGLRGCGGGVGRLRRVRGRQGRRGGREASPFSRPEEEHLPQEANSKASLRRARLRTSAPRPHFLHLCALGSVGLPAVRCTKRRNSLKALAVAAVKRLHSRSEIMLFTGNNADRGWS